MLKDGHDKKEPVDFLRRDDKQRNEQRDSTRLRWKFEEARRLAALDEQGCQLYVALTTTRRHIAAEEGLPAYHILSNQLLLTVTEAAPQDEASMAALPGFGSMRFAAYGAEFLQTISRVKKGVWDRGPDS